jgi:prepilin-type N-terminal cleavage/methylation domain-containing protein
MRQRRGFTLTEILASIVIMGIVGAAITGMFLSQSRFYDQAGQSRRARYVARTAINASLSDLRMVEPTGGIVSATSTALTIDVPYALGVVCASPAGLVATVAIFPTDSVLYAQAKFSGYAWRDTLGVYTYKRTGGVGGAVLGSTITGPATCAANNINSLPAGSRFVTIGPALPLAPVLSPNPPAAADIAGTPVLLLHRVTYEFKASTAMPGRVALWRTIAGGQSDELVAPFDASAKFRFYVAGSSTAQSAVPSPLSNMRGVELDLNSESDRAPSGGAIKKTKLVTAVFFNNVMR